MKSSKIICESSDSELVFHAESAGITFRNIASVIERNSENPYLIIPKPIGIRAVKMILAEVERLKH